MDYYYQILGLAPTATLEEIKRAYRSLAKELHPDLNPGDPQAVARFQELGRAYELLVAEKNRPPAYPPPYYPYPPGYGYYPPPPPQPAPQPAPPPAPAGEPEGFSHFAWQEMDDFSQEENLADLLDLEELEEEDPVSEPVSASGSNSVEVPEESPEEEGEKRPPIREDLLQAAFAEACQVARNRAIDRPQEEEAQLTLQVRQYLLRRQQEQDQARESSRGRGIRAVQNKKGTAFRLDQKKFWR